MVTYGGMSRRPVVGPTAAYIFEDKRSVGFWMTRWYGKHEAGSGPASNNMTRERASMAADLCSWMASGALRPPLLRTFSLASWREALAEAAPNAKKAFACDK